MTSNPSGPKLKSVIKVITYVTWFVTEAENRKISFTAEKKDTELECTKTCIFILCAEYFDILHCYVQPGENAIFHENWVYTGCMLLKLSKDDNSVVTLKQCQNST